MGVSPRLLSPPPGDRQEATVKLIREVGVWGSVWRVGGYFRDASIATIT